MLTARRTVFVYHHEANLMKLVSSWSNLRDVRGFAKIFFPGLATLQVTPRQRYQRTRRLRGQPSGHIHPGGRHIPGMNVRFRVQPLYINHSTIRCIDAIFALMLPAIESITIRGATTPRRRSSATNSHCAEHALHPPQHRESGTTGAAALDADEPRMFPVLRMRHVPHGARPERERGGGGCVAPGCLAPEGLHFAREQCRVQLKYLSSGLCLHGETLVGIAKLYNL
jgi:hypothetical protein